MKTFITKNDQETRSLAEKIAKTHIFALTGDLGSGKTTFVQGFAKGLGIKDSVISPTFVLIRQHKLPKSQKMLFHIDLYRLENENDFENIGLSEILNDLSHFILIEWAEKAKNILPKETTWINFEILEDDKRKIVVR